MPESDFIEFLPLYPDEDEATIRTRWEEWANEGVDPTDEDQWTDVRPGSFFYITTSPGIREAAREYDLMGTEVPMAGFPLWAWSTYLDDLGVPFQVERLAATPAGGLVRFTGAAGTLIPTGTQVSAEPIDLDAEAPEYQTTEDGIIGVGGTTELAVAATAAGAFGNVSSGAVSVLQTPIEGVAVTNLAPIVGGTDPETDEEFRSRLLARFEGLGGGNEADYVRWMREAPGVGRATVIPLFAGPGTVLGIISTAEGDPTSAAVIDALQRDLDPPAFTTTTTNSETLPTATIEVPSTSGARPPTNGHIRIGDNLVAYTAMTATAFTGCSGGSGAFAAGTPVTQSGRGGGRAPIGHVVVIKTASSILIDIAATVELEEGFSLAEGGGTIELEEAIVESIRRYVDSVEPGGEIVRAQIIGRITAIEGVHDVGPVFINGSATNYAVPGYPSPQVPSLDDVTLTLGAV